MTGDFWVHASNHDAMLQKDVVWKAHRPGFLIHSLLGMGLRAAACMQIPPCDSSCRKPDECPVGILMESRPPESCVPLSGVARAPSPLIIDAPWQLWEQGRDLRFRVTLIGKTARFHRLVEEVLIKGFVTGAFGARFPITVVPLGWRTGIMAKDSRNVTAGSSMKVVIKTPVRLVRNKKELEDFELRSVVRDLSFRLSVWGHFYHGMEWPAVWRFLWQDAESVAVVRKSLRTVSFHRYSGRQGRAIPMKGLLGIVELDNVSPELNLLLRFAEICGIGKGTSIGLGRIEIAKL
jgi:hypothetical protein